MDVKIIGRSSRRSATGAAAYRAGEKLQSLAHASYQSGERLQGRGNKSGKITHDYTSKGGVVHKEIILPYNAPPEYADRQTLWNMVEANEKRKDAQLAREIIAALPVEFDLEEQIAVVRGYVKENFVNKGMIADFAIHDNKDGNPHTHIMLTTRSVSRDGFKEKNTDWNKKSELYRWRKSWADINNCMFECKGLDIRIDHRTLKAQGLDRLPTIHLGAQAAALEKRGIKTERGAYNDNIKLRNNERAALNAAKYKLLQKKYTTQKTMQYEEKSQGVIVLGDHFKTGKNFSGKMYEREVEKALENLIESAKALERAMKKPNMDSTNTTSTNTDEDVPNEVRTTLTTTKRMNEAQKNAAVSSRQAFAPQAQRGKKPDELEMIKLREKIRKHQRAVEKDLFPLKAKYDSGQRESQHLTSQIEEMDEYKENLRAMRDHLTQLRAEYRDSHFWKLKRKRELSEQIELIEGELRAARFYFEQKYHIKPEDAIVEKRQIEKGIQKIKTENEKIRPQISQLLSRLEELKRKGRSIKHFMVVKRIKQRGAVAPEQYRMMNYRRNVRGFVQDVRKNIDRAKKSMARAKSIADIKPRLMRLIASAERKKQNIIERNQKMN
jgi:hypothetical protein